jgi:3-isopropylmalate/(R)-2-methylmalate dehydratase large subunit
LRLYQNRKWMTIIEKIIAQHSNREKVVPGEIVDVAIDVRLARDFGGANVVKNLVENQLGIADPGLTRFTFDCNPTGSDQQYAANQQFCRQYARENNIPVYDINSGIGTHLAIDKGLAVPGGTLVSTDSHANILGAIGCFGQGMGDRDIAAAWAKGTVWFKVPESVRIILQGSRPRGISAKDIALNLLKHFGAESLLGFSVEMYGEEVEKLSLDERITISSMATEMGAIILFIPPGEEIITYCYQCSEREFSPVYANPGATYAGEYTLDLESFVPVISLPGKPHDVVPVSRVKGLKIDSAFIGSCTNGRMEDMRAAAGILNGRKIAPGVILKIVPATDEIWKECLHEGLLGIFKESGALISNAGCAGCASGQVGQNGPGEVTVSTGNRNFRGKQGKGDVFLASPEIAAASAIAGHITTPGDLPEEPSGYKVNSLKVNIPEQKTAVDENKPLILEGRVWLIPVDNIDTDMIFHNRHLAITDLSEMGRYTFGNLKGWENFASQVQPGDIIITGRNFGAGSSRQQAVDCFKALHVQAIVARSFGAIYERNAINAGFPVLTYDDLDNLALNQGDLVVLDLEKSTLLNKRSGAEGRLDKFSGVQMNIYRLGDLLRGL